MASSGLCVLGNRLVLLCVFVDSGWLFFFFFFKQKTAYEILA